MRAGVLAAIFLALAACGGGGGGGTPDPAPPPPAPAPVPPPPVEAVRFTEQPASLAVPEGASATWQVAVEAPGPLTFQWLRNGVPIPQATASAYVLPAVSPLDDQAVFSVQVGSPAGVATSAGATLTVEAALGNTLVALAGVPPSSGSGGAVVDGTGEEAGFGQVHALASDAQGNLYAADGNRIRRITPSGAVTTIAGHAGLDGHVDGPAESAAFRRIASLAVGADGTLYVADIGNRAIRRLTPDGMVDTIAGAIDRRGFVDGANAAARFDSPMSLALDAEGALYVLDGEGLSCLDDSSAGSVVTYRSLRVRKLTGWQVLTVPGSLRAVDVQPDDDPFPSFVGGAIAIDAAGHVVMSLTRTEEPRLRFGVGCGAFRFPGGSASEIVRLYPDGQSQRLAGSATQAGFADGAGPAARFGWITQMGYDRFGALYLSDVDNRAVRRLDPSGVVTTPLGQGLLAGGDALELGPLPGRLLYAPAMAVLPQGQLALGTGSYASRMIVRTDRR